MRIARDSGIPENLGWALGNVVTLAEYIGELAIGDLGDVKAGAQESLRIAEELGSGFSRTGAFFNMGTALTVAGEWSEAERFFGEALEVARTHRISLEHESLTLANLARARVGAGNAGAARSAAEEAVALSQERGQRFYELRSQLALAEALCADRGTKARKPVEQALQRADELVEETGARVFEPQVYEARARLAQVCGDAGAYAQQLREAHRLYTEIGAAGHSNRLAIEIASL